MSEKRQPSKRIASDTKPNQEQPESRRADVIRCENCGEDYSVTYKRCPFCDERPGRLGVNGRRVDGRASINPLQIITLAVSLVIIITALFIVFRKMGPLLFGDKDPAGTSSSSSSSSQSGVTSGSVSGSGDQSSSSGGDSSQIEAPVIPEIPVKSLTFRKNDFTLKPGEEFTLPVKVDPADTAITWTSSHPDIIVVNDKGVVKNINTTGERVKTTITATAGDLTAECTIYCRPPAGASSNPSTDPDESADPTKPVAPNSTGVVFNAGSGLNIRSGPGSSYDKVASASNGSEVTVLAQEGDWYKIEYGGGKTGYASKDYIRAK